MAVFSSSHLLSSQACYSKVKQNRTGLQNFSGSSRNHHIRLTLRYNALPLGGPTISISTGQKFLHKKRSSISAPCLPSSEIASNAFTWGTLAVLPFYTFMIVAPKATITKKLVSSGLPYVILGTSYAYLLSLSWTPDTIPLMFSSKYWLPELGGIAKMFSGEMTLASAWIHLLAVDLFAARFIWMVWRVKWRRGIQLVCAFCFVLLEFLLISLPKLYTQLGGICNVPRSCSWQSNGTMVEEEGEVIQATPDHREGV